MHANLSWFWCKICVCPFSLLVKLVVPWVDIQKLEKTSNVFLTATIRITTHKKERDFSMFLNLEEVFKIMEQLADMTLRRLLDNEGFDLDPGLQEPSQITKRYELLAPGGVTTQDPAVYLLR